MKTYYRDVLCQLTDDEVLAAYDRAHEHEARADELVEELADEAKERKEEIRRMRAEAKARRMAASSRHERRAVSCYDELNGTQVMTVRVDTLEVVSQRAATEADLQLSLPRVVESELDVWQQDRPEAAPLEQESTEPVAEAAPKARRGRKSAKKAPRLEVVA